MMSRFDCDDPVPGDPRSCDAVEHVVVPRARDIGGFEVRRALPSTRKQMVGPFIFFDQMGPAALEAGHGIDVRPHPHIGLSTVTWLFEGQIFHRDSLGSALPINPGAVNWMTAGRGIVHSERTAPDERASAKRLYGIQSWVALPKHREEDAPAFNHHAADDLPIISDGGVMLRVIAGKMFGETSPVETASDMFYGEAVMHPGASMPLPPVFEERAIYVVAGQIRIAGDLFEGGQLLILRPGDAISIIATKVSRIMLLGGEPMDGPRHIWWNFVSSSKERIEQAKHEWRQGKFDSVPGDAEEFIPLPER
jgi:redox-sensitive bicupin YhaK (pirin superfamily)